MCKSLFFPFFLILFTNELQISRILLPYKGSMWETIASKPFIFHRIFHQLELRNISEIFKYVNDIYLYLPNLCRMKWKSVDSSFWFQNMVVLKLQSLLLSFSEKRHKHILCACSHSHVYICLYTIIHVHRPPHFSWCVD